jgi:fumarate hydratase subunit alpha/L(+)-tartrate dehydratase alpha subunit
MQVDLDKVEDAARELYVRALKVLPPDVKAGFDRLRGAETSAQGKRVLDTLITNIKVAERTDNLLCQDTGVPIYNVVIGRGVDVDGHALKEALRRGCARTREHSLRCRSCTRSRGRTSTRLAASGTGDSCGFFETPDGS